MEERHNASASQTRAAAHLAALRAGLEQLGFELGDKIIAKLLGSYDGVIPMKRFLAEKGSWVPLALAGDGNVPQEENGSV